MGTTTFWIIIASALLAILIVSFLVIALIKMKKRNDEIVSKVVKLEAVKMDVSEFSQKESSI